MLLNCSETEEDSLSFQENCLCVGQPTPKQLVYFKISEDETSAKTILHLLKMPQNRLLTKGEETLVERYFISICRYGLPVAQCKNKAKRLIREIAKASGTDKQIRGNGPSEEWFEDFFKRHPDIEEKAETKPGRSNMTHPETIVVNHLLSLLGMKKSPPKTKRRGARAQGLGTPSLSGSVEQEDATDALDHDETISGCVDFVLPSFALTACQDLPTGRRLQLQGTSSKQGGSPDTAEAESITILAEKEDASVTFKLENSAMGSIFKTKLSEHWKCEVFSVAKLGYDGHESKLLDKISSGVFQAMNNATDTVRDQNFRSATSTHEDFSSDESSPCEYVLPSYHPKTLNTHGLSTIQGVAESMRLGSENQDVNSHVAIGRLQTDLIYYEEGEIPSPENVESADHNVSSHVAADGIDLDSYEEGESYSVDIVKEETRSQLTCGEKTRGVIVKNEVPTSMKPDCKINENLKESKSKETSKELRCETCGKTFSCLSRLVRHSQMHYSSSNKPRNRKRKTKDELELSRAEKKKEMPRTKKEKKSYCCELCGDVYNDYSKFRRHVNKHSREMGTLEVKAKEKRHACTTCGKKFGSSSMLKTHTLVHTGERNFKCSFCGKFFQTRSSLNVHVRWHTGERPYNCKLCGLGFVDSGKLSVHIKRYHEKERAHKCDICGKQYVLKYELVEHKQIHTGEKPYVCSTCGAAFAVKAYLRQHHRLVHSGRISYTCDFCGRGFRHATQFKEHMRSHTGEKPYSCSYCGKSYARRSNINRHLKLHTGEKSYQCQQCGDKFTQNECLNRHMFEHHQHFAAAQETSAF